MEEKHKIYDFFISHSEEENDEAEQLYNMLLKINPKWEIFFDKRSLGKEAEWAQKMFEAAQYSKHLIFLAKTPETLEFRKRWVSKEVEFFYNLQATGKRYGTGNLNICYFGIIYGWNMDKELFTDDEYGAKYRAMYTSPNHLIVKQNDSVCDYFNSIKEKTLAMTDESVNPMPSLVLDRAFKYASVKGGEDINFKRERIIDALIPDLSAQTNIFTFEQVLATVSKDDIGIIGSEGGSGKTTIMTKMFFTLLENASKGNATDSLIPIYIEGSALAGSDYLIMRYIAKNLFGETTATSFDNFETGKIISALDKEFRLDTGKPNYLLLIDGYNEIPQGVLSKFNKELSEYLGNSKYNNVRVVISGRNLGEGIFNEDIYIYTIKRIAFSKVRAYLNENNLSKSVNSALLNVLSIPMYLTMYVSMALEDKINTRADLFENFIQRQLVKDEFSAEDEKQAALYGFLLKNLLPFVAYRLSVRDSAMGNFELTHDDMLDIMTEAIDYFNSREYKRRCGEQGRNILRMAGIGTMDEYDLSDLAIQYYTKICKLMRKSVREDEKGKQDIRFDFIHQVYRDFFAAKYIYEDILFCTDTKESCRSLEKSIDETDIVNLVSELLDEKAPCFDNEAGVWNYDCNQDSLLVKLIENSRQNGQCEDPRFVCEVVKLLKRSRTYDLSGCDFSGLNFTKSNLCSAIFSRFDSCGNHASTFKNAKINSENILINNHSSHIMAACTNDDTVAISDATGTIKLWKKGNFDNTPLKIVSGITYKLHKIIFSKDNAKLYGMAGHTIVEIPLPEGKFGYGQKVLYKTNNRLRDIFLDKSGELCFTTVFNSYNPKPISNPEAPDDIEFYGVNSASAVRDDKKQVAFGYISGYNGIKIYNFDEKNAEWAEEKIGVSALIEEYVKKVEKIIRNAGLYETFYNERERDNKYYFNKLQKYRCVFFKSLLFKHNGERSDYKSVPARIRSGVISRANNENTTIDADVMDALKELCIEYKEKIVALERENRALTYMHGRKISSMEYKKNSDILLVTYYNDYVSEENNKHYYHTTVAELDTSDLSSKIIHKHTGHNKIRAIYSGDDIVIMSSDKVWIVQSDGSVYGMPVIFSGTPHHFCSKEKSLYYMAVGSSVYQFDSDFTCTKSFMHPYRNGILSMVVGEDNVPYLIDRKTLENDWQDETKPVLLFNLICGNKQLVSQRGKIIEATKVIDDYYGKTINYRSGKVNIYKDGVIEEAVSLQRNLYVSGCDFSGVQGTLNTPEYMQILNFYGAKTETKREKRVPQKTELDFTFLPSSVPFEESDDIKDMYSPYVLKDNENFTYPTEYKNTSKECEIWLKVQKGSYKKDSLEPSDYSILEKVYQLRVLTSEIVYYLMNAGVIEMPLVYACNKEKIAKRMHKTLFCNLRLLKKYMHPNCTMPVYTFDQKYGKTLLSGTSGGIFEDEPISNMTPVKICKNIVLNLWFSHALMNYKDFVTKYDSDVMFEPEVALTCDTEVIRRYIKLNEQAFFARIIRGNLNSAKIRKNRKRIAYFCELASNYPYLLNNGVNEGLVRAPVIVIIGESFEYCKTLNENFAGIAPHIRKIYTYDTLLSYGLTNECEDIYFEFTDGNAYTVSLKDLI